MKKKLDINIILKSSIVIIAIITLAIIIFLNAKYNVTISRYEEHININYMNFMQLILSILTIIIMVLVTNKLSRLNINKKRKTILMILVIAIYAIFQILWVSQCKLDPGADADMVYGAAKRMYKNMGTSEIMLAYFGYYKQNIGLVAIFETLMKIFHTDSLNLFRYTNILCNVLMVLGLYNIYKEIDTKKKKNSCLFFVLTIGFLPISLLCTWAYGDFIGLSLSVWAIFFIMKYCKKKQNIYFVLSSFSMSGAIIARSNSMIFLIAILIYLIFSIKDEKTQKDKIIKILMIAALIVIAIIPNKLLIKHFSDKWNINERKEKSVITYLYMGMSEGDMGNGWYNNEVGRINEEMKKRPKEDKTIENETKEKLQNRVKFLLGNPKYTIQFYKNKILSMWAEPTMESEVYNSQKNIDTSENALFVKIFEGKNFEIIKSIQKIINCIIYIGTLIYIWINRKKISNEILLLILVFLGGFSFHLLWEAKSRYIIPYIVILIPVAVSGAEEIIEKLEMKIRKKNSRMLEAGKIERKIKNEKNINSYTNVL